MDIESEKGPQMNKALLSKVMSYLGSKKSDAKTAACRLNALKPRPRTRMVGPEAIRRATLAKRGPDAQREIGSWKTNNRKAK